MIARSRFQPSALALLGFLSLTLFACLAFAQPKGKGKGKDKASQDEKRDKPSGKKGGSQASERKVVVLGGFRGQKQGEVRKAVIQALKKEGAYDVVDSKDVKADAGDSEAAAAAKKTGALAVITGDVAKNYELTLTVRNGDDGSVVQDVKLKGPTLAKLKGNIENMLGVMVEDVLLQARRASEEPEEKPEPAEAEPAEAEEKPEEEPAEPEEEEPEPAQDEKPGKRLSALHVTLGLRPYTRRFKFNEELGPPVSRAVFPHRVPIAPALFLDARWYPGAHFKSGLPSYFGLALGIEQGFATETIAFEATPAEQTLGTAYRQWYVGAHARLPVADHEFGLLAAYGQHDFTLDGDEDSPLVPDIEYSYVRLGLDGRLRFGDVLAGFHLGKRFVLGTGPLEGDEWFRNVSASSLEGGLMGGYRLTKALDLVAGLDFLRYAFDFNPVEPGDPVVAGGATDQYISGFIGFHVHLPNE
jgi:hypothetical protein